MPSLQTLLMLREGCRKDVYLDKLRRPTVGIGHLVTNSDKLKVGDIIKDEQVTRFFRKDTATAHSAARTQAAKAGIKDANFIVYLASVNFQLGQDWHKKFAKTWSLILQGRYTEAAAEVKKSRWYSQTPIRVKDFQKALLALEDRSDAVVKLRQGQPAVLP